ncbi:MAG: hypothetical protein VB934_09655, partial [Polyangiaceae bacterium]
MSDDQTQLFIDAKRLLTNQMFVEPFGEGQSNLQLAVGEGIAHSQNHRATVHSLAAVEQDRLKLFEF